MLKRKRLLISVVAIGISLTNVNLLSKNGQVKDIATDCSQLIQEANILFDKFYTPFEFDIKNQEIKSKAKVTSDNLDLYYTKFSYYNLESELNLSYWNFSIERMYDSLSLDEKQAINEINDKTPDFKIAYDILTNNFKKSNSEINNLKAKANNTIFKIKRLIGAGSATAAFSIISSMVAGINSSSWIPFVGWAVAAVLVASLVIYIVANWSYVREGFNSFIETLKRTYTRIANLLSSASKNAQEKAKENPDIAKDATSANKMQQQVKRGQAPRDVKRVDNPHSEKANLTFILKMEQR